MSLINQPPTTAVDRLNEKGELIPPSEGWRNWFSNATTILTALSLSGTTVHRPTTVLWVGRTYFDVTLGKPIWLESISPTVWVDATGAPV